MNQPAPRVQLLTHSLQITSRREVFALPTGLETLDRDVAVAVNSEHFAVATLVTDDVLFYRPNSRLDRNELAEYLLPVRRELRGSVLVVGIHEGMFANPSPETLDLMQETGVFAESVGQLP